MIEYGRHVKRQKNTVTSYLGPGTPPLVTFGTSCSTNFEGYNYRYH